VILRGRPHGNHWLTLSLKGTTSNRDGSGATLRIGKQWGYATTSGSYLSASDRRVHFGLGAQTKADVEIRWPGGRRQVLENMEVDRIIFVEEPR
jgi:hypothetical protein